MAVAIDVGELFIIEAGDGVENGTVTGEMEANVTFEFAAGVWKELVDT